MQFIFQPLTWGFFLVLLPVLIHLINLMRHRRVKWAAMDFLLQSYKKNRRWVWLKQFFLLLLRMLALAAIVAMLAQLVTRDQWPLLQGGRTTHHLVLLDDSLSMSDRAGPESAFDTAGTTVSRIVDQTRGQTTGMHSFSLIRFSRAELAIQTRPVTESIARDALPEDLNIPPSGGQIADFNSVIMDSNFAVELEEARQKFQVTELSCQPLAALDLASSLVEASIDEQHVIYLVSDFRLETWNDPAEIREQLGRLQQQGADLHLVRCVSQKRANLAITDLSPARGTRAAGVPFFVEVTVKNFGDQPAERVQLRVRTVSHEPRAVAGLVDESSPKDRAEELPTVMIDQIGPGETVTQRVQVFFADPGQHVVEAELPEDAVIGDNRRWTVVDLPSDIPVLFIEGDVEQRNAYFLGSIFQPSDRAKTGIAPVVQSPTYLRDVRAEQLESFQAIYLLSVDRLDEVATRKIEQYVRNGGGVAIFLGPETQSDFYSQWYADGSGLFPVPVGRPEILGPNVERAPDVEFTDHPVFQVLLGERNPFARDMRVDQYIGVPRDWTPPADSTIRVIARLRNQRPLVVQRTFGEGRVVAFLSHLSPQWNNWARMPSFVVVGLELHVYLAPLEPSQMAMTVGTPIDLALGGETYRPEVRFDVPTADGSRRVIQGTPHADTDDDSDVIHVSLGRAWGSLSSLSLDTTQSGIYEAIPTRLDGNPEVRRLALNVDTVESDLALATPPQLAVSLKDLDITIHDASEIAYELSRGAGFSWSQIIMLGMIGLLLGEQILAYSASYHPAAVGKK